jgi:ParB family chromosome partitioning protein
MSQPRGLGRGFDALIPTDVLAPGAATRTEVRELAIGSVKPNPHQPRTHFEPKDLESLAASIKEHGIMQPLIVTNTGDGTYELIAGERRLRAAGMAGLETVPAIVRTFDDQQKLELALIENLQRADLNPIETAAAYRKLMDEFNLTLDQIGKRIGQAVSTISNIVRLLNLPSAARDAVAQGKISEGHARAILAVGGETGQLELLKLITERNLTVRQAEELARSMKQPAAERQKAIERISPTNDYTKGLESYLGTKVRVQLTAKGGRLVIEYGNEDDLKRIYETIKK